MARLPDFGVDRAPPSVAEALAVLPPLGIFGMVAHAETAFRPWLRFGAALLTELELDPGLRELAILEVARLSHCEYERVQHRAIALALDVDEDVVTAVEHGSEDPLTHPQQAVVAFTRQVVRDVRAGEADLDAVRAFLSPREVVELLLVIGHYMAVARLAETTGLEPDEPAQLGVVDTAARQGARA